MHVFNLVRRRSPRNRRHAPEQPQPLYRAGCVVLGFVIRSEASCLLRCFGIPVPDCWGLAGAWASVGARIRELPAIVADAISVAGRPSSG
jgi:hypothetical protein